MWEGLAGKRVVLSPGLGPGLYVTCTESWLSINHSNVHSRPALGYAVTSCPQALAGLPCNERPQAGTISQINPLSPALRFVGEFCRSHGNKTGTQVSRSWLDS